MHLSSSSPCITALTRFILPEPRRLIHNIQQIDRICTSLYYLYHLAPRSFPFLRLRLLPLPKYPRLLCRVFRLPTAPLALRPAPTLTLTTGGATGAAGTATARALVDVALRLDGSGLVRAFNWSEAVRLLVLHGRGRVVDAVRAACFVKVCDTGLICWSLVVLSQLILEHLESVFAYTGILAFKLLAVFKCNLRLLLCLNLLARLVIIRCHLLQILNVTSRLLLPVLKRVVVDPLLPCLLLEFWRLLVVIVIVTEVHVRCFYLIRDIVFN